MIKNIFFDFFGVISCPVVSVWIKQYCSEERIKEINQKYGKKIDLGYFKDDELYEVMSKDLNLSPERIKREWLDFAKINLKLVEYIKELRKHYNVYLLSNAHFDFLNNILLEHDLYNIFDKVYISSKIKKIKPNADFYNYVVKDLNANPDECVMIDDKAKNIDGAKLCGLNGIVYKNNEQLNMELNELINDNLTKQYC